MLLPAVARGRVRWRPAVPSEDLLARGPPKLEGQREAGAPRAASAQGVQDVRAGRRRLPAAEEGGAAEGLQHVADHDAGLLRQGVLSDAPDHHHRGAEGLVHLPPDEEAVGVVRQHLLLGVVLELLRDEGPRVAVERQNLGHKTGVPGHLRVVQRCHAVLIREREQERVVRDDGARLPEVALAAVGEQVHETPLVGLQLGPAHPPVDGRALERARLAHDGVLRPHPLVRADGLGGPAPLGAVQARRTR
mmetsp:Transcript_66725/g.174943  ORF Transcript_66725/g.174943 Transcript_66725/m.174943 type:complete len:248 (+) Transcript_66725:252-995(+)